MRGYRHLGRYTRPSRHWLQRARRTVSEYAPAPPSPNDLKAPLPDKFSVGKNNKLKAVLFEYDLLAGSASNKRHATAKANTNDSSRNQQAELAVNGGARTSVQALTQNGEKLVNEITGLLGKARFAAGMGGESLQDMGKTFIADLKEKMGAGGMQQNSLTKKAMPPPLPPKEPANAQDLDPKAKYMAKLRQKTGGRSSTTSTTPQSPGDADLLFAARERVSAAEGASLSAWMLRQGAGDLLLYLAARSVRLGVIASPRTTPAEFESFVEQLRRQSTRVQAAITPMAIKLDGLDAVLTKAMGELDVGGRGSAVLVVGSSEPILSAATAAEMFTARYHPPNGVREGVIQTFTVRDIDGVRTVVEQVNGISFR